MFGYQVRQDSEGFYYALSYGGKEFYIHRFTFNSNLDASVAAFNHVMLRMYWDKIIGRPTNFFNGRV